MPEKQFEIWLSDEMVIRIQRRTEYGRLIRFAVVLVWFDGLAWTDIGRFDTAHGVPHQDVLGAKAGLLKKIWYDDLTPKRVFQLAIQTFQADHEEIRQRYCEH